MQQQRISKKVKKLVPQPDFGKMIAQNNEAYSEQQDLWAQAAEISQVKPKESLMATVLSESIANSVSGSVRAKFRNNMAVLTSEKKLVLSGKKPGAACIAKWTVMNQNKSSWPGQVVVKDISKVKKGAKNLFFG